MKNIPISLSKDYCKSWGVWEACREFIANALDADDNCFIDVDKENGTLTVESKGGTIPEEYLLLGGGSKSSDDDNVGQHCEGFKVGMLVGIRERLSITIFNGSHTWIPKMCHSDLYGTECLHVQSEPASTPRKDTVQIEIEGLTEIDCETICDNVLRLRDLHETYETEQGTILLDEAMKGKVYVGGIYVCTDNDLDKGYDFNPNELNLDRDRSLARTWDIISITEYMYQEMSQDTDKVDLVVDLIESSSNDTSQLEYQPTSRISDEVKDKLHENFVDKHGEDAIVATSYEESENLTKSGYKKVIYTGNNLSAKLIKGSNNYRPLGSGGKVRIKTCDDYLQDFFDDYQEDMTPEMEDSFMNMWEILNGL